MLSLKQQKFCEYYVESGNATEAAKKAGYSEKTASEIGRQNLRKLEICNFIEELTKTEKQDRMASAEEVLEFFASVMRDKDEATKNRLKAAENLAKRYGLDKGKEEVESVKNEGITINIKDCSDNGT